MAQNYALRVNGAAIVNAPFNATCARIRDLPFSQQRVKAAPTSSGRAA